MQIICSSKDEPVAKCLELISYWIHDCYLSVDDIQIDREVGTCSIPLGVRKDEPPARFLLCEGSRQVEIDDPERISEDFIDELRIEEDGRALVLDGCMSVTVRMHVQTDWTLSLELDAPLAIRAVPWWKSPACIVVLMLAAFVAFLLLKALLDGASG